MRRIDQYVEATGNPRMVNPAGLSLCSVSVLCLRALSLCSVSVLCLSDGKRSLTGNLRMLKPAGQRVLLV